MAPSIGFDFDECLIQAYSLMPIILFLERLLIKELRISPIAKVDDKRKRKTRKRKQSRKNQKQLKNRKHK